jgi:hypothetical protein
VTLELRAKEYLVLPNDTLKVPDDIPNGSYGYGSVIGVPGLVDDPYIVYEIGSGCSGTFNFLRSSTSILIVYGSTTSTVPDSAGHPITTYHVGATVSSSDPTGAIVGP